MLSSGREDFHQVERKAPASIQALLYTHTLGFQQARKMAVSFDLSDVCARMLEGDNQIMPRGAISLCLS